MHFTRGTVSDVGGVIEIVIDTPMSHIKADEVFGEIATGQFSVIHIAAEDGFAVLMHADMGAGLLVNSSERGLITALRIARTSPRTLSHPILQRTQGLDNDVWTVYTWY